MLLSARLAIGNTTSNALLFPELNGLKDSSLNMALVHDIDVALVLCHYATFSAVPGVKAIYSGIEFIQDVKNRGATSTKWA
jgi:hypothetical protein